MALCLFRRLLHTLMPIVFFIALISLGASTGKAATATDVGGPIFADETWTKANSPYIAVESILIMNGATLTIEPGVEIRFDKGKALTVQTGALVARGSTAEPIRFTSNSDFPQPGDWGFIFFDDNSVDASFSGGGYAAGSVLQHVIVEYAGPASNDGQTWNTGAVRVRKAAPFVDNAVIRHSGSSGIAVECSPSMRISNSTVSDNGWSGISVSNGYTCEQPIFITNNTVARNASITSGNYPGLSVESSGGQIVGNIIEDNFDTGLALSGYASQTLPQTIADGNVIRRNGPQRGTSAAGAWVGNISFSNNAVYNNVGLGVYLYSGGNQLTNNTISGNTGGGVVAYCNGGNAAISANKIAENTSRESGAGIKASACGNLTITNNSIVFNHAKLGRSAIELANSCYYDTNTGALCKITQNTITGQTTETAGTAGGVYIGGGWNSSSDSPVEIRFNNLYGNSNYDLHNAFPQNATAPLDARSNWWGSTNILNIIRVIYDFIDDSTLASTDTSDAQATHVEGAPPAPPSGLAVSFSGSTFKLTWQANAEFDINGYRVYYDVDGGYPYEGKGAQQGDSGTIDAGFVTTYDLSQLPPANKYHFTVTAYDSDGNESWFAREVVYYVPKPINLIADAGTKNIALAWNPTSVADVAHYRLSRAPQGSNNFQPIGGDITNTFFFDEDATLAKGSSYCYQVTAMRAGGDAVITSNTTCTAFGQLSLWVPDSVGVPGSKVVVPINVRNADGLRIDSSDIWLDYNPQVIAAVGISRTILTADYTWAHAVQNVDADTDRVKIASIHGNVNQLPPEIHGDGSLFWLTFEVKGAADDTSPLDLQDFIQGVGGSAVKNEEAADVPLVLTDGVFTVKAQIVGAYSRGDVDGNGVVQAADASLALRLASGQRAATPDEIRAGDINGNGAIQAADASMILYYAANGQWPPVATVSPRSARSLAAQTTLRLDNVSGRSGSTVESSLSAFGLQKMAGGEFVVVYDPALIAQIGVQKGSLSGPYDLRFEDDGAGQLRFALADDAEISGDGQLAVIRMTLVTTDTLGASAPLLLADARINDLNGRDFVTGFANNGIVRENGQVSLSLIQLSPGGLSFSGVKGESNPAAQSLTIDLDGAAENWTASANQPWISLSAPSGNGNGSTNISVDMANLNVGIHNGEVTVTVGEETSTIAVVFNVQAPAAVLNVSPTQLSFDGTLGGSNPAGQAINVDLGGVSAEWTATPSQSWISASPSSGSSEGAVTISVDMTGLTVGSHSGQVTVASGDQSIDVAVSFTVDEPAATLQLSPLSLSFSATAGEGNPASQTINVNLGGVPASWTVTDSQNWLSVSPSSGSGDGSVTVSVDMANLTPGTHNGQVTVSTRDQSIDVPITFVVDDPDATLAVTPSSLSFNAMLGGSNPASQTFTIDPGDASTGWSAPDNQEWISVSPLSGVGPGEIGVSVDINGLSAGSYTGQVTVTTGAQTINRNVTLTITAPGQEEKVYLPAVQR